MPADALPQPIGHPRTAPTVGGAVLLRCPRGAHIAPPDAPGDHFCSICDCGRRTGDAPAAT